jgi:hypothetical protein
MTLDQEKQLVNAIVVAFGDEVFDTTSVILRVTNDDDEAALALANAIEAAIPNCRHSYSRKGASLRRALEQLAKKHFEVDEFGWWRVRQLIAA